MRRVAAIGVLAAIGAAGMAAIAGADDDVHSYEVEMYNAFGLVPGSDVRVAGTNVGSVADLTVNADKRAVVTVEVAGDLARFGDETTCESSPQSLIAEYFLDCAPAGEPLPDGGAIPAERVEQTVQPDIVANTLREPFRQRLTLLVNEFGTALAGNPEALNEAIRLGAPALTELEEVTEILAGQAETIRDLNVDSERVSGELARYRDQIVEFIDEAEDLASTALERREDVSRGFDRLDDYLGELRPTLGQLRETAGEQAPLLARLRTAAPELHRLSISLPVFQRASESSLSSLGEAAVTGERALRNGREELELLAEAGRNAPVTAEALADLLRDLDDPRRAVEINDDVARTAGRTGESPGTFDTMGYTGFEGLLNYPYFQALAINQFDRGGHTLHINLYEAFTGPCGSFSSGRDVETGEPGVPAQGGGTTTDFEELARCGTWLGPNQPGINEDIGLPPYDPSVCPKGTSPEPALALCDPGAETEPSRAKDEEPGDEDGPVVPPPPGPGETPPAAGPDEDPPLPQPVPETPDLLGPIEDLLDLPSGPLDGLKGLGKPRYREPAGRATRDILDFLFGP